MSKEKAFFYRAEKSARKSVQSLTKLEHSVFAMQLFICALSNRNIFIAYIPHLSKSLLFCFHVQEAHQHIYYQGYKDTWSLKVCCQCTLGTSVETCEVVRSYVVAIFLVCKQISSKALPICYVVVSSLNNLKTSMGREERGYTLGGSLLSGTSSGSKSPSRLSNIFSLRRPPC